MRDLSGRALLLAVIVLIGLSAAPVRAAACVPPPPTPWFVESIAVDPPALPAGVSVRALSRAIVLSNTTETELYVLGQPRPALQPYRDLGVTLPEGLVPIYQLLPSRGFEWRGPRARWVGVSRGPQMRIPLAFAPPDEDRLRIFTRDLQTLNRVGDQRPADVAIPAPQQGVLHLVYDDQLIAVPFTVGYALNPGYDPESVARGEAFCDPQKPLLRLCLLVTGVVVLAILAIMASYSRGQRRARGARSQEL